MRSNNHERSEKHSQFEKSYYDTSLMTKKIQISKKLAKENYLYSLS